jgi:hypothetical protein|tara:strand:+ start:93 stop:230 length:138 start_codon:yes stop_codon:yes gene_type:complete
MKIDMQRVTKQMRLYMKTIKDLQDKVKELETKLEDREDGQTNKND